MKKKGTQWWHICKNFLYIRRKEKLKLRPQWTSEGQEQNNAHKRDWKWLANRHACGGRAFSTSLIKIQKQEVIIKLRGNFLPIKLTHSNFKRQKGRENDD